MEHVQWKYNMTNLQEKADYIRKEVIRVACKNNAGHIAPSLSCVDILVSLYYRIITVNDRLIFSKAHGGYGLYAILADTGKLPKETWESFNLPGCTERRFGIEVGCGSLGHGLPIATGLAFAMKIQKDPGRVFCIVGDGELQEGSNWEAIQFGVKHGLDNLVIVVDDNGLQAMDTRFEIMEIIRYGLRRRLVGFGLSVREVDGHNIKELCGILAYERPFGSPQAILAKTVKGYGLKCAENKTEFHFRVPDKNELAQ